MKNVKNVIVLALALSTAACGWRRTPVPIISESGSTGLLVGSWAGDYSSAETGRSGSISFELASEKDTAYCDVVMMPAVQNLKIATDPTESSAVRQPPSAQPLKIRFIRLGEGRITGTLEPYVDPDCGCTVSTTFIGKFSAPNKVEGTYVTTGSDSNRSTKGQWKATRKTVAATTQ